MQFSNIPPKVPLPFANSGTKNTIPVASQVGITPGAASLTTGFPPLTFTPVVSGGVPPFGADFNGILNLITAIQQWQSAGGFFPFDSAFATEIGGYPLGAILLKATGVGLWQSTIDNNTSNPDTGGANWLSFNPAPVTTTYSASYLIVAGGGGSSYGGGGGGGFLTGSASLVSGTVYTFLVGGGGSAGSSGSIGGNGANSSFVGLNTAIGGGGGGNLGAGYPGGSGGGGGSGVGNGGAGTTGQGYAGGNSTTAGYPQYTSSGGGGAGAVGGDNGLTSSGAGGNGLANTITGSSIYYAGGGGGGSGGGSASNGLGGGSAANGGGGAQGAFNTGGSGVVIISIPTANYTGIVTGSPTITTNGSNTVIKFTSSGTYTA